MYKFKCIEGGKLATDFGKICQVDMAGDYFSGC